MPPAPPRALQIAVALAGLVPVSAGTAGMLLGPGFVGGMGSGADADSHFRYLSGLLLGLGLAFWATIPRIAEMGGLFRILTGIVVVGGIARLLGLLVTGLPGPSMVAALGMELVVTPALCLWQARVAAGTRAGAPS